LVKYIEKNIGDPTATWKVIPLVSANIKAVLGPAAQGRDREPTNGLSGKGQPLTKPKPSNVRRKPIPGST
jgi:hypothetical protein